MKSAPGSNFLGKPYRTEFKGIGKGIFSRTDKEFWLGCLQLLARLKFFSSLRIFTIWISWIESISKTPFAIGWSPNFWWSPVRHSRFLHPARRHPGGRSVWQFGSCHGRSSGLLVLIRIKHDTTSGNAGHAHNSSLTIGNIKGVSVTF